MISNGKFVHKLEKILTSCLAKALDEIPKLVFLDSLAFEGLEDVVFDWELIHDFKLLFGGLETRLLLL